MPQQQYMVRCFRLLQLRRNSRNELSLNGGCKLIWQPCKTNVIFEEEKLSTDKYAQPVDKYFTEASVN